MTHVKPGAKLTLPSGRRIQVLRLFPANGFDPIDRLECGYLCPFGTVMEEDRGRNRLTVSRLWLEKHGRTA